MCLTAAMAARMAAASQNGTQKLTHEQVTSLFLHTDQPHVP